MLDIRGRTVFLPNIEIKTDVHVRYCISVTKTS